MRRWLAGAIAALGMGGAAQASVSDDFSQNPVAAIQAYSSWHVALIPFFGVSFQNGTYIVSWNETPKAVVADQNARNARLNGGQFSWNDWLASSRVGTGQSTYTITCLFPASAGKRIARILLKSTQTAMLKIRSADGASLVFDCTF